MTERILVVLPHPDDEAFGISGTLAKFIAEGSQVTYACLTLGQMGRNMGIPAFANRETLPNIRKEELIAACQAIGIQDLRMLGFHDKTIEFEEREILDEAIRQVYDEIQPTLVFTFLPGFSVHPDHDATGAAVVRVMDRIDDSQRPPLWCVGFSHDIVEVNGEPDIIVDVSLFLAQKRASIAAHQSQFQISHTFGDKSIDSEEIIKQFGKERFWSYRF